MDEQEIFLAAVEITDPVARASYLDRVCAGNPQLRGGVEALLQFHAEAGDFLGTPAVEQISPAPIQDVKRESPTAPASDGAGHTLGYSQDSRIGDDEVPLGFLTPSSKPGTLGTLAHYEIQEVLGRGAFGIVLRAFDEKLHRSVAIKVMSPELASTSPPRKRFLREARTTAAIRHENVVAIHAVEEQPLPYLVMEYIPGQTLQQALDEHGPLDVPTVLHLGQQIASGLAAAHAQGLIHRDIKPANILLENGIGGRVKITDFGLARAADDASLTRSGMIAGTPMFMSPEQALSGAIDSRSDLFSLGSVLYVTVSGRPPFRASSTVAMLKRVVEDKPRPIAEIVPNVPDWLCAIIARLQAKQPSDRFSSTSEVAELLGRCLADLRANRPVHLPTEMLPATPPARPVAAPTPFVVRKEVKPTPQPTVAARHHWPAVAAIAMLLLLAFGFTEATGLTKLTSTVIRLTTGSGTLVIKTDDPSVKVTIDGEEVSIHGAGVQELVLKPGQYQVAALKDGAAVSQQLVTIQRGGREVVSVSMESNSAGRSAAQVNRQEPAATSGEKQGDSAITLSPLDQLDAANIPLEDRYDWQPKELVAVLGEHRARHVQHPHWPPAAIAVSPNGKLIAIGALIATPETSLFIVDAETLRVRHSLVGHTKGITSVAFTPDGQQLISGSADATIRVWDVSNGTEQAQLQGHTAGVNSVAISSNGDRILSGSSDATVRLWNLQTNEELKKFDKHTTPIKCVSFACDGRWALSAGGALDENKKAVDSAVRVWDIESDQELQPFDPYPWCPLSAVSVTADSRYVAMAADVTTTICERDTRKVVKVLDTGSDWDAGFAHRLSYSRDGRWLAVTGRDELKNSRISLFETQTWRRISHNHGFSVAFFPDNRRMAVGLNNTVRLWDTETGQELHPPVGHQAAVTGVAFSPDCRQLLSVSETDARLWDLTEGQEKWTIPVKSANTVVRLGFSHDASRVVVTERIHDGIHEGDTLVFIDAESGRNVREWNLGGSHSPILSPDHRKLVSISADHKALQIWDAATYKLLSEFREIEGFADGRNRAGTHGYIPIWSPEPNQLYVYCWIDEKDQLITLDATTGKEICRAHYPGPLYAFTDDGRTAYGCQNTNVYRIDLSGPEPKRHDFLRWHDGADDNSIALAPDGKTLVSYDTLGRIIVWDAAKGEKTHEWKIEGGVNGVAISQDGRHIATANVNGTIYILRLAPVVNSGVAPILPAIENSDPDRRAAEWVLSIGGGISIKQNGTEREVATIVDLPNAAFELTVVNLRENSRVTDAGLAHFQDCRNLKSLDLNQTIVSDAGLSWFRNCKDLASLNLDYSTVTDAGLTYFKDCKNISIVYLAHTKVTDAGLSNFRDCQNFINLSLGATNVSDAGLAHFKDCKNLLSLELADTLVTDEGLAHFNECKNLRYLNLAGTQVSDAGLARFKDCKNLAVLHLPNTQVSDAGLAYLVGMPTLQHLTFWSTRISLRGYEQLTTAIPKCGIYWSEPNRAVAGSVLNLGGTVEIGLRNGEESRAIKAAADLPGDYFQVRRVSLAGVANPSGNRLLPENLSENLSCLRFPEFDQLESIDLSGITGLDYNFLAPIHALQELSLANAGLNDAALANLPKLPSLKRLVLDGNDIRGTGLTSLKNQPELIDLSLGCPTLTDLTAKNLAELKQLKRLSMAGSGLTDAGIKHLANLTSLESLDLRRTEATTDGVANLQVALPNCKIAFDSKSCDADGHTAELISAHQ